MPSRRRSGAGCFSTAPTHLSGARTRFLPFNQRKFGGAGQGDLVQHSAGSGKSLLRLVELRPEMPPVPTTSLRPRWALPVAVFICALVVGWPAFALFTFGPAKELWWAIALLATIAAAFLYVSAHGFVTRRQWGIEVSDDGFEVFGHRIGRERVRHVARHADALFKGVRIELLGGGWIKVPAHLHRPRKVLAAFKRHGYWVGGRR